VVRNGPRPVNCRLGISPGSFRLMCSGNSISLMTIGGFSISGDFGGRIS
jgi:hypothetical protein